MSVSSVIKAAMSLQGISRTELAEKLETTPGSLNVKMNRGAWSVDDLIRASEAMGLQVALLDKDSQLVVRFKAEDAAPPRRKKEE